MIGIIMAMEKEHSALSIEKPKKEKVGSLTFIRGEIAGKPVVTAVCGIGKVAAAMCAEAMILHFAPDFIVNCGVAGKLSPALHILDIAIGTACVQYDMDTSAIGDPIGLISSLGLVELPCDKALYEKLDRAAAELDLPHISGLIATADRFCDGSAEKTRILSLFPRAIACEMEGGAVAQVCLENHVPCALFRAISDEADEDAPVSYDAFTEKAAANAAKLLRAFIALA